MLSSTNPKLRFFVDVSKESTKIRERVVNVALHTQNFPAKTNFQQNFQLPSHAHTSTQTLVPTHPQKAPNLPENALSIFPITRTHPNRHRTFRLTELIRRLITDTQIRKKVRALFLATVRWELRRCGAERGRLFRAQVRDALALAAFCSHSCVMRARGEELFSRLPYKGMVIKEWMWCGEFSVDVCRWFRAGGNW